MDDLEQRIAKLSPAKRAILEQKLQEKTFATKGKQTIPRRRNHEGALLSFSQQRMWFLDRLEPGNPAYNRPTNIHLSGQLNVAALEQSLNEIIRRHEVLRTNFLSVQGQPEILITPHLSLLLSIVELCHIAISEQQEQVQQLAAQEAQKSFDLAQDCLVRATLIRLSDEENVLLLTFHHIIFDGWSMGVLLKELVILYDAFASGKPSPLPELAIQYIDFADWQRPQIQGEEFAAKLAYWQGQLGGELPVLELPIDRRRPPNQTFCGARHNLNLSSSLTIELKRLSQQKRVTLFMTLLAAFKVLLYRYTGQDDIIVGSPIAGRDRLEIENLIGVFINTLALRTQLTGNLTFEALLAQVRQVALDSYKHQDIPFEKLVEELQPKRNLSRTPIFQVLFQLRNIPQEKFEAKGVKFEEFKYGRSIAVFDDLTLDICETNTGLSCLFEYNTDLFEAATIKQMAGHFEALLKGILANPEQPICQLPLLTEAERHQLLDEWNDTEREYPQDKYIHQLFEEQVERTPDAVAVVFEEKQLTYQELNKRANQLAHYLQKLRVKPEMLVGICLEPSLDLIVGLLAILKAGSAYVPLDPDYPKERLAFMLEDTKVPVLLTQQSLVNKLSITQAQIFCLDTNWQTLSCQREENPAAQTIADNLAYVIYTSGSTGKPKGVMVSHASIVNRLLWGIEKYQVAQGDRILQKTSLSFDVSVWEIFGTLLAGACLILVRPGGHQDPAYLVKTMAEQQITHVDFVPAMLKYVLDEPGIENCSSLRYVTCGGESLSMEVRDHFFEKLSSIELHNCYGPTEVSIDATSWVCDRNSLIISIGRPISNTQIYILDPNLNPTPIGVPGELYIGGDGLAQGYLNRPELTAEKFISNPFFAGRDVPWRVSTRLYQTGDLARYLPDGNIEFLGRIDNQVKIRGFRIELGEIEAVLQQHPDVRETVVMVREDIPDDQRLVAYIIPASNSYENPKSSLSKQLRSFLGQKLPDYMIPAAFVVLEQFPLTPNGKIDRRALPVPDLANVQTNLVTPRNPQEEILVNIWAEVLRVESIGIEDNFFELGGHSLLATQVIARIRDVFSVEIPLKVLFESPTIAEFALKLAQTNTSVIIPSIQPRTQRENLPLSFAQEGLWFSHQLEETLATYNISSVLRLQGKLNFLALQQALETIVDRHEILRTNFIDNNGYPLQVILASHHDLPLIDLQNLAEEEKNQQLEQLIQDNTQYCFNLAAEPLFRTRLLRFEEQSHLLLLIVHHIIADGWSMGILVEELSTLYRAYSQGQASPLETLPIQYADFALWQQQHCSLSILTPQLNYWKQQLAGLPPLLELPTDKPRPAAQTFCGSRHFFELPPQLTQQLKHFSQQSGVTLYMTFLAVLSVLLSRYTRRSDIPIGSVIGNRNRREIEPLIGLFVNALVLRVDLKDNPSFGDLLKQVRRVALEAYAHQDLPFEKLVEELQPERSLSYHPLFQVMFVWENTPQQQWEMPDLTITEQHIDNGTAKFDLLLSMEEKGETIQGCWEYSTDLWEADTIERMMGHFQTLLEAIIIHPEQRVEKLPLLTAAERKQLLVAWNQTQTDYPASKCIHQLFEEQVAKTPDAVAVVWEDLQLTYRQLNEKANQLAHYLQSLGVRPETLVGICIKRSLEMVIAVLAILKAGGAYVPLDPSYPPARLEYMLTDSEVKIILTEASLLSQVSSSNHLAICLDKDWPTITGESSANLSTHVTPENLAYLIYTSGSTGLPKGVALSHQPLVNLIQWQRGSSPKPDARTLQYAPLSFDVSFQEIACTLCAGGTLVLITEELRRDFPSLWQLIDEENIERIFLAFVALRQLAEVAQFKESFPENLQEIITAGEQLKMTPAITHLLQRLPHCWLQNQYGPSETHVVTAFSLNSENAQDSLLPPIGRPIANTQIYLLDSHRQPVPLGVPGELYVGGIPLARGYHNKPELTRSKFISHPFVQNLEARLYRTGDLARYLSDGNIEFLGRIDNQVKIRGFRIELAEIEAVLQQHPQVKESVVLVREDIPDDQRLVAYIIPASNSYENPQSSLSKQLRSFLGQKLPDYMVPAAFVVLEQFPLTPNGKIDRRALPIPDLSHAERTIVAPRNPHEEILANIWTQVLRVESIGIEDNFFELGGHSLLATQVISRIRDAFSVEIPLKVLFESPTIAQFAQKLSKASSNEQLPPIVPVSRDQKLPLSFAQKRLWFLNQLEPDSTAYNMPYGFRLKGILNLDALEQSFRTLIRRYEVFRTIFSIAWGEPMQVILPDLDFTLSVIDLQVLDLGQRKIEAQRLEYEEGQYRFNLAQFPLFRVKLLRLDEQEHLLLINIHHIIFDGWSSQILFADLTILYQSFAVGQSPTLSELSLQYADFALWQRAWLSGDVLASQLAYWKQHLSGMPVLQLPIDRPYPPLQTYQAASYCCVLPPALAKNLKTLSHQEGVTLFMTLLAAFKILLSRYSGQDDIIVGTPIAGRNCLALESLIGFFVNSLVLRTDLGGNPSFQDLLKRVREVTLGAYAHQDLPFEKLVEELQPARKLNRTPLFQVWFNMVNLAEPTLELTGLTVEPQFRKEMTSKFDLTLYIREQDQRIEIQWVYNTVLFNADTITLMAKRFQHLLEEVTTAPEQPISTFSLLTKTEYDQLLAQRNTIAPSHPFSEFLKSEIQQSIPARFQQKVKQYPNQIAIKSKNFQWTYQELERQAKRIAQTLLAHISPEDARIALLFEHDAPAIAAILAVLKVGKAYVPLDPTYPKDRVSYILEDSLASWVLTNDHHFALAQELTDGRLPVINIDQIQTDVIRSINLDISPHAIAYLLYTSGSTGQPKGVIQTHSNVLHFIRNYTNNLHIAADDRLTLLSSYSFDAAVIDIFGALLNGATLCPFDLRQEGLGNLAQWLKKQEITIYHSTPTVYRYFLGSSPEKNQFDGIRLVVLGGEAVIKADVELYRKYFSEDCLFVNGLGCTESSFHLQYLIDKKTEINRNSVPVGYLFDDTEILFLDRDGKPTDILGEIAIRSPHIALGYWRKPELSATAFLPDFQGGNRRIYRTGDWGCLRGDGTIEYLGRKDFQVKIRGFRLELGEIEAVLNQHPDVRETVVMLREDIPGEQRLVAYIIPHLLPPLEKHLRSFLEEKLPDYMIPQAFVILDQFPLTPNRKIDRLSLPLPNSIQPKSETAFVPPRTELERQLTQIWQNVLSIKSISVQDSFFDLGGHSLLAVRLFAEIEQKLGKKLHLSTLFKAPSVEEFAILFSTKEWTIAESAVVSLQPNGNKHPFFFVNSISYAKMLALYLGNDQPFYALNIFGLTECFTEQASPPSLEKIAAKFIENMQTIQPEGPYFLLTYCRDSFLLFEIAQQLHKQGAEVAFIAFIDVIWQPRDRRIYKNWQNFRQFGLSYLVEKMKNKLRFTTERLLLHLNQFRGRLATRNGQELSPYLEDVNLLKAYEEAILAYTPHVYPGKITLLLSNEWRSRYSPKLSSLVAGGVELHEIPGYHNYLFEPPYVQVLAEKLRVLSEHKF